MARLTSYKELIVWQKSMELVKMIYLTTETFPTREIYGLASQMRRAAISIPSNIAEGYGRKSQKEYTQFYSIAYGSTLELETQLLISRELNLIRNKEFTKANELITEISRMLHAMIIKFQQLNAKP